MASLIFAHRGASADAPENSIAAFLLAAQQGADGIELDVHMSADGRLIVLHDEKVNRTTDGKGRVIDMTLQELKCLRLRNGDTFCDERIPTLEEVYEAIKKTKLCVNVELKCDKINYAGICGRVIGVERDLGMRDRVFYSSFNHTTMDEMKKQFPSAITGLLMKRIERSTIPYAKSLQANAIHPDYRRLLKKLAFIGEAQRAGLKIHTWTVDIARDIVTLDAFHTNTIITNASGAARAALHAFFPGTTGNTIENRASAGN